MVIDWDAAMLFCSCFLAYSRPSSTSGFCSNGSVRSLASGSFGPQFTKPHPIIQCGTGHHCIQQEEGTEQPIAPEGVVV